MPLSTGKKIGRGAVQSAKNPNEKADTFIVTDYRLRTELGDGGLISFAIEGEYVENAGTPKEKTKRFPFFQDRGFNVNSLPANVRTAYNNFLNAMEPILQNLVTNIENQA